VKRHSQLIQGDGKSEKRGTNPLSAILSSLAGEDTHATAHANLKSKHPDIFRQDGLQLRGFDSIWKKAKRVPPCFVGRETIDGFYYRLPLGINPKEQPKFKSIFNNLQNIQFEGDIWYKKDDWHFVARSTVLFPRSDRNWGLIQLIPQAYGSRRLRRVIFKVAFQSQQPRTPLEQQIMEKWDFSLNSSELSALLSELPVQPQQVFINRLSLGVHPARTTLVLTSHGMDDRYCNPSYPRYNHIVSEEIIKLQ